MNVHHLELFYFVAKFEGITEAVRKMPYGIQQPAVSGQVGQLEKSLGVKLFHRRPFALTPAGKDLYDFIYPFFSQLSQIEERIQGEESQHLRLAASTTVLTNHLPGVLSHLRKKHPELRLTLREMNGKSIEIALQKQEADIAVSVIPRKAPPGIKSVKLLQLPLVLLVPAESKIKKFSDITAKAVAGQIPLPLVSIPKNEPLAHQFNRGLAKRKMFWEASMEVSELELVQAYVAGGFGLGLTVDIPKKNWPKTIRKISLPKDFPPLTIGIQHTGDLKNVALSFVELATAYAAELEAKSKKK